MAKSQTDAQSGTDEFTRIFDEYRAKIDEITRRTEKNLQHIESEPDSPADDNGEMPEDNVSMSPPKPDDGVVEVVWQPDKEAAKIIETAKKKAQQIINEAEERSKKEAKKKTQSQVDKIILKAKKESDEIVAQAQQAVEREKDEIVSASKREAELLLKEITEKCREETRAQSSHFIAEAREKAETTIADITSANTEISRLVTEIVKRVMNTVQEFEGRLQADISELAEAITESQKKLEQVVEVVEVEEEKIPDVPPPVIGETVDSTVLSVVLNGERSNGKNGSQPLFSGQVELKAVSSFEYQHIKKLKSYLTHVSGIKYMQEYASEKEMAVLFDIKEPLPLLEIFGNVPTVDKVINEADGISLVLKKDT